MPSAPTAVVTNRHPARERFQHLDLDAAAFGQRGGDAMAAAEQWPEVVDVAQGRHAAGRPGRASPDRPGRTRTAANQIQPRLGRTAARGARRSPAAAALRCDSDRAPNEPTKRKRQAPGSGSQSARTASRSMPNGTVANRRPPMAASRSRSGGSRRASGRPSRRRQPAAVASGTASARARTRVRGSPAVRAPFPGQRAQLVRIEHEPGQGSGAPPPQVAQCSASCRYSTWTASGPLAFDGAARCLARAGVQYFST